MKLCLAGSRDILLSIGEILFLLNQSDIRQPTEVVSGTCDGVDKSGEAYARMYGITIKEFKPEWDKYGRRAAAIRNKEMAEYCDGGIIVRHPDSKGSKMMAGFLKERNKLLAEYVLDRNTTIIKDIVTNLPKINDVL